MKLISTRFDIPASHPFDNDLWFENFVGHFVLKLLDTRHIHRYWFSRYQTNGSKFAQFRFYIDDYSLIQQTVTNLMASLGLTGGIDNPVYDAGEIREDRRFLGTNQRQTDRNKRKDIIWDFLHATAVLYVDTLSHVDAAGYLRREENQDQYNCSTEDTFEAIHHMFSNISGFDPRVFAPGQQTMPSLISAMYYFAQIIRQFEAQGIQPPSNIPALQADQRVKF